MKIVLKIILLLFTCIAILTITLNIIWLNCYNKSTNNSIKKIISRLDNNYQYSISVKSISDVKSKNIDIHKIISIKYDDTYREKYYEISFYGNMLVCTDKKGKIRLLINDTKNKYKIGDKYSASWLLFDNDNYVIDKEIVRGCHIKNGSCPDKSNL